MENAQAESTPNVQGRLVLAGGKGFIGQELTRALAGGREIVVLTRSAAPSTGGSHHAVWDGQSLLSKAVDAAAQFVSGAWDAAKAVFKAGADAVLVAVPYVLGVALQVVSNARPGLLDPLLELVPNEAFHEGRDFGERITLVLGLISIVAGLAAIAAAITFTTGGGAVVAVGSGGALALPAGGVVIAVDGTLVAIGGTLVVAGGAMMSQAFGKGGGKNSKHANKHRKDKARADYEEARAKWEELRSVPKKSKQDSIETEKARRLMEHLKRKADFSGENHSQKAKGH